tara:strand:+ start:538 stop:987 length:450 start_codon:yes stop_codon:yes gene_type:complete
MKLKDLDKLMNEVSATGGGGVDVKSDTGTPGFIGRGGQELDGLYSGGFYPSKNDLLFLLQMQIDDRIDLEDWNKKVTPLLDLFYRFIPSEIDKLKKLVKKDTPKKDKKVSNNLVNIVYDKTGYENYEERKANFTSGMSGGSWKDIYSKL